MATSQTAPQSEGAETSVKSASSLDSLSVKIVFKCHLNGTCILWNSILLGKVDVNGRIIKMLSENTKGFMSLFHNDRLSVELRDQLLIPCANSLSFLNLSTDLISKIAQGNFNDQLGGLAMSLLEIIEESWIIPGTLMGKQLLKNNSFVQFFIASTQHRIFSSLNEVEVSALKIFLSMLFYYIDNCSSSICINEAHCCLTILDSMIELVMECNWISIFAKASKAVLLQIVGSESTSTVPISDVTFEFLSEYILETVGSSRVSYKGCSVMEVLKVYNKLIFKDALNRAKFEQMSLLSEKEVLTYLEEYENIDNIQSGVKSEWIHEEILPDFNSTKPNDYEGNLLLVDNMLRAISNILSNCNRRYSALSVDKVNVIKTIISTLLGMVRSCETTDKIHISNFIASDDTLIEVIILLLNSKGKFAVPAYGIFISMTMELILLMCVQYSSICCDKLACAGALSVMIDQIKELQTSSYNKINEILLHGHIIFLFKAIQPDPYSSISKFDYEIAKQLTQLTTSSNLSLRICAKLLLSVLPATIDKELNELSSYMQLKDDEISRLLDMLNEATTKDYVSEGYGTFTIVELLSCLVILTKSSFNSKAIYNSGIMRILIKVFEFHRYDVQKLSLQVIISLLQFDSVCYDAFCSSSTLLLLLKYLRQSPCTSVSFLAENALRCYQWELDTIQGLEECYYQYAYSCYLIGQYEKGSKLLELCNQKHMDCKLLRGKLLFYQYRKEQRILESEIEYFTIHDLYAKGKVKDCYDKASKVIKVLGLCLDYNVIDTEGLDMLNIALLDYVRETTGLKEIKRCYLCLKQASVRKSHLCPESLLRIIAEEVNPFEPSSIGRYVTNITNRHFITTPKTETKWLLCDDCEQKLSRNGEQQFVSQLFQNVFPQVKIYNIKYDTWLYEYTVGLFFRCISQIKIISAYNEKEVFRFNQACRKYLSEMEKVDPITRAAHLSEWEFFIYINVVPTCAHYNAREKALCHILSSTFTVQFSLYDLTNGSRGRQVMIYFCTLIIGNVTFLVKFKPDSIDKLPVSYMKVSAVKGLMNIPCETQRWDDILPGVAAIIQKAVCLLQTRDSEIGWGKIFLPKKHRTLLPPSCDDFRDDDTSKELASPSVSAHVGAFAKFLEESVVSVSLLPGGFEIKTDSGNINLPPGHIIMGHTYEEDTKNIVFLANGVQHDGFHCYAIVIQNNIVGKQEMIYGFHVHPNQDDVFTLFTPSQVEGAKEIFVTLYVKTIMPRVIELFNEFGSFTSFEHIAKIHRICNDVKCISVGSRCPSKSCWYCRSRCHNCMKPSMYGYNKEVGDTIYNHCSDNCQKLHFGEISETPVQNETDFDLSKQPHDEKLLLLITSVLPTKLSPHTVFCLHIAVSQGHENLSPNIPYCVLQIRTTKRNVFLSFYITSENSPGNALWYCKHPVTLESIDNIRESGKVQQVLSSGLKQLGFESLTEFISNTSVN